VSEAEELCSAVSLSLTDLDAVLDPLEDEDLRA
jgi:hypothetical protein